MPTRPPGVTDSCCGPEAATFSIVRSVDEPGSAISLDPDQRHRAAPTLIQVGKISTASECLARRILERLAYRVAFPMCLTVITRIGGAVVEPTLSLRRLKPVDWPLLRAARLEALRDSPHAFMSSYVRESGWGESEWRSQFDAATWIIARETEEVIGLVRSACEPEQDSRRNLESIWVAPRHRGRAVFRRLLQTLTQIEREMGVTDLLLWVLEDNHVARRAYEALGFEWTGESQPLTALGKSECRMRLMIRDLPASEATTHSMRGKQRSSQPDLRPSIEAQEVQGLVGAADNVDAAAEPLPVG
jgi:ribosomal protein S18 acetylase RimI-like enzyme